jgi:hypothetical protein
MAALRQALSTTWTWCVVLCERVVFKIHIQVIYFARLDLLHRPGTQRRRDLAAQQLLMVFERSAIDLPALAADSFLAIGLAFKQRKPPIDPVAERGLVGRDMLAGIAGSKQPSQFCLSVLPAASHRLGEALGADTIAQAPASAMNFPRADQSPVTVAAFPG